jgi:phosphatidylglycerophosphate synthase
MARVIISLFILVLLLLLIYEVVGYLIAYRRDMTIMRLSELKLAMGTVAISMLMARAGGLELPC